MFLTFEVRNLLWIGEFSTISRSAWEECTVVS